MEIHTETPAEGVSLSTLYDDNALNAMYENLNLMADPFSINFNGLSVLSNSHLALAASEFARSQGKFDEFHNQLFIQYFSSGRDIGQLIVLQEIALSLGLDPHELKNSLYNKQFDLLLQENLMETANLNITGTPTFIIEGQDMIVGAQSIDSFRRILDKF